MRMFNAIKCVNNFKIVQMFNFVMFGDFTVYIITVNFQYSWKFFVKIGFHCIDSQRIFFEIKKKKVVMLNKDKKKKKKINEIKINLGILD
ncbi:hypothetical protein Mgra_00003059 [Meloidogyne graminicola]|uniref:Uncharacterized protein n=1 Tax=Meloidogyne graminicola TaxID=189291 RepID=A0A8S9ZV16_9BILA|nr:hypothetical protein Mgra_00003059 [Meloidogyne graminicola]